jgi:ADP-ribose pyrophosphatase
VKKGEKEKPGCMSTRRVYAGKVISLDVDVVRFPNGSTGELELIRHPGASAVVPFLDEIESTDPRVLLIRQYRYAASGFIYEIPAGRVDPDETPEKCALRELREETGYIAGRVIPLTTVYTTPGFTDEKIHLFAATGLTDGPSQRESDEILELEPMPLSRAIDLIRSGEIMDGKTIIALLFVAALQRSGISGG